MPYHVIIIGSGLGGLVCGAILARAGLKVGILEQAAHPGGCMQSYRREGWLYDTGLHYVGGLDRGEPLHAVFRYLGLLALPWRRMDTDFDHVVIGHRTYCLAGGYDRFVEMLAAEFPHQREALARYAKRLRHITPADMDISAWDYLHSLFSDEQLISVLAAPSFKMAPCRESLPLFSLAHSCNSYIESSWRLQGSGQQIVEQLQHTIEAYGGRIIVHAEVVALRHSDDGRGHLCCRNGDSYEADSIVSDIHPQSLVQMLDPADRRCRHFIRRMQEQPNTYGIFTASLRLRPGTVRYRNHNAYVYDSPDVWALSETDDTIHRVMVSSRYPDDGTGYARQIDLLTPMPWQWCRQWEATRVGHRGEAYATMCRRQAAACVRLAERFIPHLGEAVERCYTSTPLTYRDYLLAPQGNAFGMRKDCRRSLQTFHHVRTPIPHLFLTGQSVMLPGVEGVTMTAIETCRHILGDDYMDRILQ